MLQRFDDFVGRSLASHPDGKGKGQFGRGLPFGSQIVFIAELLLVIEHLVPDQQESVPLLRMTKLFVVIQRVPFGSDFPTMGGQITDQLHGGLGVGIEKDAPNLGNRAVAQQHDGSHGADGSDAILGNHIRRFERGNGGSRKQRQIGTPFDVVFRTLGRRGQQQIGTKVTFVTDTVDEWYRIEIRHCRYAWNRHHHPYR